MGACCNIVCNSQFLRQPINPMAAKSLNTLMHPKCKAIDARSVSKAVSEQEFLDCLSHDTLAIS